MGKFRKIMESGKLKIGMYETDDHNPPHVHCKAPGAHAKINIKTGEVVESSGFNKQAIRDLVKAVKQNKEKLLDQWEELYGEEK